MIESRHKQKFINDALQFDSNTSLNGRIAKIALEIAENGKESAVIELCNILRALSSDVDKTTKQLALTVKDDLIRMYGYEQIVKICESGNVKKPDEPDLSLEELLSDLNGLVGLAGVKSKVNDLIAFQKVQKLRRDNGLATSKNTLHLAFTGNPGTGKTTVARIVGRIYKQLGLLSSGHFIEVSRTDLIAGYQGQTALKVKSVIDKAKGGVLFIDEAYSITENEHTDSYGRECLTELTKALEDYRDDLVVIVAGYTEPMRVFFESNPGLKSRFNTFIEFDGYNADELFSILEKMCLTNEYELMPDASDKAKQLFKDAVDNKADQFANGRFTRNLYESIVMNHARRVANIVEPTLQQLKKIEVSDFDA